jgi:hypothetical protein
MHPITVRQMKFDVPSADEFHPLCIAGSSVLSYTHLATGLCLTYLEPFFVKSLRLVMDKIRDEALREDADASRARRPSTIGDTWISTRLSSRTAIPDWSSASQS